MVHTRTSERHAVTFLRAIRKTGTRIALLIGQATGLYAVGYGAQQMIDYGLANIFVVWLGMSIIAICAVLLELHYRKFIGYVEEQETNALERRDT